MSAPTSRPTRHRLNALRRCAAVAVYAATTALATLTAHAGSLSSISPGGVTPGQDINITGTGFNTTAGNNAVTFTPVSGPASTVNATAIATIDAQTGVRRLTVTVPSTLPVGPATVGVTDRVSGVSSDTRTLDILGLTVPEVTSTTPGATGIVVRILGSPNSQFVPGNTRAAFGAGITVRATTVDSATSLRATIDVAASAALGPRDVAVISTTQRAVLIHGFAIAAAPTNKAPTVTVDASQTITLPANAVLSGMVTDDGLPSGAAVTSAWSAVSGPGTVTFANASNPATTATLSQAGTYLLRLTASDTQLATSRDVTVTAQPGDATIHVTGFAGVYDGGAHGATGTATGALGEDLTSLLHTGSAFTAVPGGTAHWTFDGTPIYKAAAGDVSNTIAPANATIHVDDYTGVYDGNPHGATGTAVGVTGESLATFLHFGDSFTDAPGGSAQWTFDGAANYKSSAGSASIAIARANATIVVTGFTGLFDGAPHGAAGTATGVKGENLAPLLQLGAAFVNPPGGTAHWSFAGNANYRPASGDVPIAITQTSPTNRPPIARPGGPYAATTGVAVAFDGSASSDPDNDSLIYAWSFGDGAIGSGPSPSHTYAIADRFAATLTVTDTSGASSSATVGVDIAQANRPPAASAGGPYTGDAGAPIAFTSAASDPDHDTLTLAWDFGDGATGTGLSPVHAYASAGTFTVTLTVTDAHGASTVSSTSAVIGAAADRSPPVVRLTAANSALPGTQVVVTASANDNVGVTSVAFDVDHAVTEVFSPPYRLTIDIPPIAVPGSTLTVQATAFDAAHNAGADQVVITIVAAPDIDPPTVAIQLPPQAAPGRTVLLSATASDDVGVRSVAFSSAGVAFATIDAPPYQASFTIPADAAPGSSLPFAARASDFANNTSDSSGTVAIVDVLDTTPPVVALTAPASIVEGAIMHLSATATDDVGVASVAFIVDDVIVDTVVTAPFATDVRVGRPVGSALRVRALAKDSSNNQSTSDGIARVVSADAGGAGVVTGRVYDDTTGLPIEGAAIALTGTDVSGRAYVQAAISDARGQYRVNAGEGHGVVHVTRNGWTRVDRSVEVVGNRSVDVFDARLTPLASAVTSISAVLGGTVSGPTGSSIALVVPPGGVAAPADLAVTPIGAQGLEGVLPPGWSPLAAVDVTPHAPAFSASATLTLPVVPGVPAAAPLVAVRWNDDTGEWDAVSTSIASGGATWSIDVAMPGQYAVLLGDTAPASPPVPAVGDALSGVVAGQIPTDAATTILPESTIVVYEPGVRTGVSGRVAAAAPVSSGTHLLTRISESYQFTSGLDAEIDPYTQDLFLYQAGGGPSTLTARYTVTPSIAFEAVTLQRGVITVELFDPAAGARVLDVVGADGGSVSAPTGERVDVPANALATPVGIVVRSITAAELGFDLPAGVAFVGGLQVSSFGAPFTSPVTLSMPRPPGLPDDAQVLVARITAVGTTTRLVLVGIGQPIGSRLTSSTVLGDTATAFEGVRVEGRYLFLRTAVPVGFAAGVVRGTGGAPFTGALVSVDTYPLCAQSRGDGAYVAAAPIGPVSLLAQDVTRNDRGSAQGAIAAIPTVLPIDLQLAAQTPRVLSISPTDHAENVPLSNPIVVTFSEPINPATVTPASVALAGPDGITVAATLALSNGNAVVTLRPALALPTDTPFTVTIAATIADPSGYALGEAVISRFASLDVTPPPPPAAGAISASLPGAEGTSTITATQGTAGPHDTVSIVNQTRGTTTPVLVDPAGGFSAIVSASVADRLRLRIVDPAGNVTEVGLPRFSRDNADGSRSVAIDAQGGTVDGPGGVSASIKPGTFPDGAVVTIKPVAEADFPIELTPQQKAIFAYAGGVTLDFGGQVPQQYVNVSVPAAPQDQPQNQWVVGKVTQVGGRTIFNVVDTAKLRGGNVTTSSPPCPGVNAAGMYGILKSNQLMGLTYAGLAAATEPMLLSVDVPGDSPLLLPFEFLGEIAGDVSPMCLPVMSGRVTVVPNAVTLSVNHADIFRDVARVVVKNVNRGDETSFSRQSLRYPVVVEGKPTDRFEVVGTIAAGPTPISFTVVPFDGASVELDLGIEVSTLAPSQVVVRNLSINPVRETPIAADTLAVRFTVAGGPSDQYEVHVQDATRGDCPAPYTILPSANGPGNLVARALDGTIDPTRAEMDAYNAAHPDTPLEGRARTKVQIQNVAAGSFIDVPDTVIKNGGFTFAFDGGGSTQFQVWEFYDAGGPLITNIPIFRITMTDVVSGDVAKVIVLPAPPADQPLNLGTLTNDHDPPSLTSDITVFENFDPSGFLTFTFSEPMDADSLKNAFFVIDQNAIAVAGQIRISGGNSVMTFVPDAPLAFGQTYTISFAGVTDRGGNALPTATVTLKTIAPHLLSTFSPTPSPAGIQDIRIRTKTVGGTQSVYLVTATASKLGNSLITIDATDPSKPKQAGTAQAGFVKRQVNVVPDVKGLALSGASPCAPNSATFNGDLAVTNSFTIDFTYVSYFDVTDPTAPCLMSNKILTATPDSELFEVTQRGTYHVFGVNGKGVATIQHSKGIAAYSAIAEAGLFVTDVGSNVPEKRDSERVLEGNLPGDYEDVVAHAGRLLAINRATPQLVLVDPSLAVLKVLPLPDAPRRLVLSEAFPFDANGNGTLEPGEFIDAVFIGGDKGIVMVDVTNVEAMHVVGMVSMPAAIRDLDVDRGHRRLAAVDIQSSLYLVDLLKINAGTIVDANGDGVDDRIVWSKRFVDEPDVVRLDTDRSLIYVGTPGGLQVFGLSPPNLTGTATYTYFPVVAPGAAGCPASPGLPRGGIDFACPQGKPIRGAIVELRNDAGAVLQATTTDAAGYYSFDAPPAPQQVEVIVKAALGRPGDLHLEVVDNFVGDDIGLEPDTGLLVTSPDRIWAVSSGKFTVNGPTAKDISATTVWTPGAPGVYAKGHRQGAPFAILDDVYHAETVIRQADPAQTFPLLRMKWSPNNVPCGPCPLTGELALQYGMIEITAYHSGETAIYIQGAQNLDTDEYDDVIVIHEWSHYFEDKFSHSDSVGGNHAIGDLLDPRLAFGEAFATAHALMLLCDDPMTCNHAYIDSKGLNQAIGSNYQDIENDNITPFIDASGNPQSSTGWMSEESIREFLWDLFDPKSAAAEPDADNPPLGTVADNVDLGYPPIYKAMIGGERTTPAFTSIFSFMAALLADPTAQKVKNDIFLLGKAEGMDFANADQYEGLAAADRLYTSVPIDGTVVATHGFGPFQGQPLQTRTFNAPNGGANKLYEHALFKFTATLPGFYEVVVDPTNGQRIYFSVKGTGPDGAITTAKPGATQKVTVALAPGDHVIDVDGDGNNVTFTIAVTYKGVGSQ